MIKTGNSHAATNMSKFVRHIIILIMKHLKGNSQIYDIVHYSTAFLSTKKDFADTKDMSMSKARITAAVILFMCTKPERSQIDLFEFLCLV